MVGWLEAPMRGLRFARTGGAETHRLGMVGPGAQHNAILI